MEPRPRGCVVLLLLLPGVRVQGSTPGSRCDCTSDIQRRYGPFCCRGCPMGHYLKARCTEHCGDSTCLPCPRGTFLARENHYNAHCTRCQACDEEGEGLPDPGTGLQVCGPVPPLLLPQGALCPLLSPFQGSPVFSLACPSLRPLGHRPLLSTGISGTDHSPASCQPSRWPWRTTPAVAAHPAGLSTARSHLSPLDSTHALLAPPGNNGKVCTAQLVGSGWTPGSPQAPEVPCQHVPQSWDQLPSQALGSPPAPPLSPAPPAGSPAAVLQPGPQLYDVMDAVPARRWKEFVRTLGLREAEIEAVEVEIGRFRDQQYEMLKRWRQQQPAGLGAVYAALERMGLDGCAEDLRLRLQRGP
uniref:TNF receptor superfamily member 25 n=1 Tax=Chinchilla lanigera TaxID=34839 RepID=A0A8C2VCK7_CHILA